MSLFKDRNISVTVSRFFFISRFSCVCFYADDGHVLLHVPAEYLGGGLRCGQTRNFDPQRQPAGLDSARGGLRTLPHHIWRFPKIY